MEKEQVTPSGIHIAIYVDGELNEKIRKLAYLNAMSKSGIGNIALKEYADRHEKELNTAILNGK